MTKEEKDVWDAVTEKVREIYEMGGTSNLEKDLLEVLKLLES